MAVTAPSVPATTVAVVNPFGQLVNVTVTGGTITGIMSAPAVAPAVATPAVPLSTVTATNPNVFPVAVAVAAGTVTHVAVNGSDQFTGTNVTAVVPPSGTIAITYSVAPTWLWTALVAGFAGTSIASPSSVQLWPGGSITLVYSVAPTWAWTNPQELAGTAVPGGMNSSSGSQALQLPLAPHSEASQLSLGTGVSN